MSSLPPQTWLARVRRTADNQGLLSWLREQGSLTLRLKRSSGHFELHCLHQQLIPVPADEAAALGISPGSLCWMREVLMSTDGKPAIFAHTVMACQPRHPFDLRFGCLGNRSLGSLLFANPCITRGSLAFRRVDRRHPLYLAVQAQLGSLPPRLWARRSRFGTGVKGILVTEIFLPQLLQQDRHHMP